MKRNDWIEGAIFVKSWKKWKWRAYAWLFGAIATFVISLIIWNFSKTG